MAKKSIFDISYEERFEEQESIKAALGLESKAKMVRLNMTLPPDYKTRFLNYCQKNYINPSAQLRAWIDQHCND